jgi:predicted nucleic acid-binding protein
MKVFFDTNAYVAEALLGQGASEMLAATTRVNWRIFVSDHVLEEAECVMVELGFS